MQVDLSLHLYACTGACYPMTPKDAMSITILKRLGLLRNSTAERLADWMVVIRT